MRVEVSVGGVAGRGLVEGDLGLCTGLGKDRAGGIGGEAFAVGKSLVGLFKEGGRVGTYWPAAPWAKGTESDCWSAIVDEEVWTASVVRMCLLVGPSHVSEVVSRGLGGDAFQTARWQWQ